MSDPIIITSFARTPMGGFEGRCPACRQPSSVPLRSRGREATRNCKVPGETFDSLGYNRR